LLFCLHFLSVFFSFEHNSIIMLLSGIIYSIIIQLFGHSSVFKHKNFLMREYTLTLSLSL